jgi:hypothetical protein
MALALLQWAGEDDDGFQRFDVDIGSNHFYAWAIGSRATARDGVPMVSERSHTSELIGPLQPGRRGKTVLRVPGDSFDADHHRLQLLSFRDEELRGPAASDVISVPWRWTPPSQRHRADSVEVSMSLDSPATPIAFEQRLSHAQFLDALLGIVSKALPVVKKILPTVEQLVPVIGSVLKGNSAPPDAGATGGGGGGGTTTAPTSPDLGTLLAQLLQQLTQATAATPHAATPPAVTPAAVTPAAAKQQSRSFAQSTAHRYSYASWAQLLAALPALSGVLEKVLTPETVQALIGAGDPNKLMKTVFDGLTAAAKIGQEATDKLHEHLRALNPGLGDDVLIPLLASMSMSQMSGDVRHKLSRRVSLGIADLAPIELGGYPQVAFRHGDEIILPVTVDTDRPIPRPTLRARLKDAGTLATLATREWRFDRIEAGRMPQPAALPGSLTARLRPGREYLVDLALTWQGRSGLVGATTCQLIRIVGEMTFDTMDSGREPVRLDDVDGDRAWWHRVWSGQFDTDSRRVEADVNYEYRLATGDANRRRETVAHLAAENDSTRLRGTISSGLDVAVAELSRLARRVTSEPLASDVMTALADESFAAAFGRAARTRVSVRGRRGGQAAIWVWPEVKVHDVTFQVPDEVSSLTGQILSFKPIVAAVPVPAIAHVVTTKSG